MLSLVIVHPITGERRVELEEGSLRGDGITLGRSAHCGVMLDDATVSRAHARLCLMGGAVLIEDLGSTAGTTVNGRRLLPHQPLRLAQGDRLVLGACMAVVAQAGDREEDSSASLSVAPPPTDYMPVSIGGDRPTDLPRWNGGELTVRVVRIVEETHDVKTFVLAADPAMHFVYQPGQSVVVNLPIDGRTVRRTYTLSSSPSRPHLLSITVKRIPAATASVPAGIASTWLHRQVRPGTQLAISGPHGAFSCLAHPHPRLLFLSAGAGITPMLSMVRWLVDTGSAVDTAFVHWARTARDLVARRELELLAAHDPRLRVVLITTRPETGGGWTGLSGHADPATLRLAAPDLATRRTFCCGPDGFMRGVKESLLGLGLPADLYHQESFGARRRPVPAPSPEAPTPPLGAPIIPPPAT